MLVRNPPAKILDGFWMLGTAEYPVFCFCGDGGCTIFEAAISAVVPVIARQLAELGFATQGVQRLVITHAHPDHVMGVPVFRKLFPSVSVLASAVAAKTLEAEKAVAFFCKVDQALTAALQRAGSIDATDSAHTPAEMKIGVDRILREGDGVSGFVVLETPGHSDCSLSFHEPQRGILIISDLTGYYLPELNWWWPNYFAGYAATLQSIRRLAGLGAEVLCLRHNAVIKGGGAVAEYFRGALAATEAYHERIVRETLAGKPSRQLAEELGAEVFARTQLMPLDFFQKNCALLVKQSLQHAGVAEPA
ncbi:MAG: MBL fold metallo-hydrolase [Verrucomicrobiae bacterium]|nr:MBL fold metallo-hydrolase [Verrucomicrobiae bacterium]